MTTIDFNSYHVGVVPVAGSGIGDDGVLVVAVVVDDGGHALPAVLDVVKVPPHVAAVDYRRVVGLEKEKKRNENKVNFK